MHAVSFGETGNQVILVLPDTLCQIGGNAHIERTVSVACQDINTGLLGHCIYDAGFRLAPE